MTTQGELSWHLATRVQLCVIACDEKASLADRISAAAELKRRNRQKHGRLNYREKVVYPR